MERTKILPIKEIDNKSGFSMLEPGYWELYKSDIKSIENIYTEGISISNCTKLSSIEGLYSKGFIDFENLRIKECINTNCDFDFRIKGCDIKKLINDNLNNHLYNIFVIDSVIDVFSIYEIDNNLRIEKGSIIKSLDCNTIDGDLRIFGEVDKLNVVNVMGDVHTYSTDLGKLTNCKNLYIMGDLDRCDRLRDVMGKVYISKDSNVSDKAYERLMSATGTKKINGLEPNKNKIIFI